MNCSAVFDRSDIDVDAISSRVALDPVIAGKVLRMANSAQFCRGRRIGSIHDAVMVLGFNRLRIPGDRVRRRDDEPKPARLRSCRILAPQSADRLPRAGNRDTRRDTPEECFVAA